MRDVRSNFIFRRIVIATYKTCTDLYPRCFSTTCAICSRTCTDSAASQPPTPHLTFSPSPSPVPSPRRSVLSLNSSNVNLPLMDPPSTSAQFSTSGHRRKHVDDDDLPDRQNASLEEDQGEFGPGCGKFICRNCCYEDAHKYVFHFRPRNVNSTPNLGTATRLPALNVTGRAPELDFLALAFYITKFIPLCMPQRSAMPRQP